MDQCLECGEELGYGRSNRKFCCDACRTRFHNRVTRTPKRVKMRVMKVLDSNHRILENLISAGITTVTFPQLMALGYRFGYMTARNRRGREEEVICYDIRFVVKYSKIIELAHVKEKSYLCGTAAPDIEVSLGNG